LAELAYELLDDGVLYELKNDVRVKVQYRSPSRVRVTMQQDKVFIPPETGDLGTSGFREKLVNLARERFREVNGLVDELDLIALGFEAHLKEREEAAAEDDEETNAPELVGMSYRIVSGGFVRLKNTREGEIPQRLTNFVARVEEESVQDDGAEVRRVYRVAGKAGDKPLPKTDVPAAQFGAMNWVNEAWGLSARITAGQGAKDYTREAIELYSQGARIRHIFRHTGFRMLSQGERVYLHNAGAVGAEGVEVELEGELSRYALPDPADVIRLREAIRWSLRVVDIAPDNVMFPLLAAVYLAPLSELIAPDFVLWFWAPTGNLKSTLAALALSHYGDFTEDTLPISFESTPNFMERILFLFKDILAVVDDWRPSISRADAAEMDKKAQRLLRGVGNRQGRGRMNSDTTLRHSYPPRGVVVATAESLPEGPAFQSAAARAFAVNVSREEVDLSRLSELQRNKAELPIAMSGYVEWVAKHYDELAAKLEGLRRQYRDLFAPMLAESHPRTPNTAAALMVGIQTFERFAVGVGAISAEEGKEFLARAVVAITEAAAAHTEATKGEDPATRFVEILRSLFMADKVYVKDREDGTHPEDWASLGWERRETQNRADILPERSASFVGWIDDQYLYLDKDAAYATVSSFAQRGEIPFGIKPRTLWRALSRSGISVTDSRRTDTLARIEGQPKRVVQIRRAVIFQEHDES
jgi:hypothetical protein